jgi:hypothetical protein
MALLFLCAPGKAHSYKHPFGFTLQWGVQIPEHQFYKQNNPPIISRRFLPQTLTDKIGFFVGSFFKLSPEKDIQAP